MTDDCHVDGNVTVWTIVIFFANIFQRFTARNSKPELLKLLTLVIEISTISEHPVARHGGLRQSMKLIVADN